MKKVILENLVNHDIKTNNFYCYLLIDPKNREVFYIGKGNRKRYEGHQYLYRSKNKHKNNKISNIIKESGYFIAQIVYSTNDEQKAYEFEEHLIKQYKNLTNKTNGGNYPPSKPCRKVKQYNLFGEYIKTFNSYMEAGESLNAEQSMQKQILECCRGVVCTALNYYWSWEDSYILKPRTKILPIKQLSKSGIFISRYTSASEAGNIVSGDGRDILKSIRRNGTAFGYVWEFHPISNIS